MGMGLDMVIPLTYRPMRESTEIERGTENGRRKGKERDGSRRGRGSIMDGPDGVLMAVGTVAGMSGEAIVGDVTVAQTMDSLVGGDTTTPVAAVGCTSRSNNGNRHSLSRRPRNSTRFRRTRRRLGHIIRLLVLHWRRTSRRDMKLTKRLRLFLHLQVRLLCPFHSLRCHSRWTRRDGTCLANWSII
jgi:hypothetical protein